MPMPPKRRRLELALLQAKLLGPVGLAVAVGVISILIGVFVIVAHPTPERFDPWDSAHSDDPAIYCRTYGKGGTVCSEASKGVRDFRERQAAKSRQAN